MHTARSKAPRRQPKPFLRRRTGLRNRLRMLIWAIRAWIERRAHTA